VGEVEGQAAGLKLLPDKVKRAVGDLVSCWRESFTGSITFHFHRGVPQFNERTNKTRYDK
jgi:hypothetical protein